MEYSDQSLFVSDLATLEGPSYVIEDATFKDCTIKGPAVVKLSQTGATGGGIDVPGYQAETVIIVAEEGRETLPVGVVSIRNCQFDGCSFEGVTFMATKAEAETLRAAIMANVPQS